MGINMRSKILAAAVLSLAAVGSANAAGCIKGAVVGAVGGHVAGHHAVVGAVAGCVIGHHMAKKKAREEAEARRIQATQAAARPAN